MDLHGSEISRVCIDPRISRVCSKFRAFVNGFVPNFAHSRISRRFDTHAEYNIVKPYAATSCQLNAERRGQVVLVLVQRRQDRDDEHEWRRPSDAAASFAVRPTMNLLPTWHGRPVKHSAPATSVSGPVRQLVLRFRAFDTTQTFRDVNIISRICSESSQISLTTPPWFLVKRNSISTSSKAVTVT